VDAKRYRWLRERCEIQEWVDFYTGTDAETLQGMDAAIDAAIASQEKPQ
jgi:hypothetical protein